MKKTITIMTLLAAMIGTSRAQETIFPNVARFQNDVFLSDAPTIPLASRVPTGEVARVDSGLFLPSGSFAIDGSLTLRTNRTITMTYRPEVTSATNSVVINSIGTIDLRQFVDGEGWLHYRLTPTNPPLDAASVGTMAAASTSDYHTAAVSDNLYADKSIETNVVPRTGGEFTGNVIFSDGGGIALMDGASERISMIDGSILLANNIQWGGTATGDGSGLTNLPVGTAAFADASAFADGSVYTYDGGTATVAATRVKFETGADSALVASNRIQIVNLLGSDVLAGAFDGQAIYQSALSARPGYSELRAGDIANQSVVRSVGGGVWDWRGGTLTNIANLTVEGTITGAMSGGISITNDFAVWVDGALETNTMIWIHGIRTQ